MEDKLTRGEQVAWLLQGVIRNWWFLSSIIVITAVCWATNNAEVLIWWNLSASLMALIIEAIVGRAMFGQTRKDAQVIRRTLTLVERLEPILTRLESSEQHIEQELSDGILSS